jgi:hypothetical protein
MRLFERGVTSILVLWSALILLGYNRNGPSSTTQAKSESQRWARSFFVFRHSS